MPNTTKGANSHPFSPADMQLEIIEGIAGNALDQPEFIAQSRPGIATNSREWQLKKLIYSVNGVIQTKYAQFNGLRSNGYVFSIDAVPQTQELLFSRGATLLAGNTISVTINGGTPITQAFVTDHQATLDALATQIQADAAISVAARRGDHIVEITGVAAPVAQVQEITFDAALVASNSVTITVDGGTPLVEVFATNSDTTLAALAVQIQTEPGVLTAVVTSGGGGSADDRVIVVTAQVPGVPVVFTDALVTLGASQAGITFADTTPNDTGSFVLTALTVTGGIVQASIESREKLHGQLASNLLTYS